MQYKNTTHRQYFLMKHLAHSSIRTFTPVNCHIQSHKLSRGTATNVAVTGRLIRVAVSVIADVNIRTLRISV